MDTPVVFLIFNRPELTERVFDGIASFRPRQLLVVADGPRLDRPGEAERCDAARKIIERVDWPCDVQRRFSPVNLGCGRAVSGGLDWAFSQCETAIVLEDDCVPNADFFTFCEAMLEKYSNDSRVAHISGDHFHGDAIQFSDSYYFSRFPHVWGWASWRRAWKRYDFSMSDWPTRRDDGTMSQLFADPVEREFWQRAFESVYTGKLDTWDMQWVYSLLKNGSLAINPAKNLISNIGFGMDATHTRRISWQSEMATQQLGPLRHPSSVIEHRSADARTFDVVFDGQRLRQQMSQPIDASEKSPANCATAVAE